jgi:hypothetical protein
LIGEFPGRATLFALEVRGETFETGPFTGGTKETVTRMAGTVGILAGETFFALGARRETGTVGIFAGGTFFTLGVRRKTDLIGIFAGGTFFALGVRRETHMIGIFANGTTFKATDIHYVIIFNRSIFTQHWTI